MKTRQGGLNMSKAEERELAIIKKSSPFVFQVGDGKTAADLVRDALNMRIGDLVSLWVEGDFPTEGRAASVRLTPVVLERDMTEEEVSRLISSRGLGRPTPEDALRMAPRYPGVLEGLKILFPHEPHLTRWFGQERKIILGFLYDLAGCSLLAFDLENEDTFQSQTVLFCRQTSV